jgi:hypothetical protein
VNNKEDFAAVVRLIEGKLKRSQRR